MWVGYCGCTVDNYDDAGDDHAEMLEVAGDGTSSVLSDGDEVCQERRGRGA